MINHYAAIQVSVFGVGNLRPRMFTLANNDGTLVEVASKTLTTVPMSVSTDKSPIVLAGMKKEKVYLELKTTDINEGFRISEIDVFVKPTASGGPQ